MAKKNFTANNSKNFRNIANREHKGFNSCLRDVLNVWDKKNLNAEESAIVDELRKAVKKDGVRREDFSANYIITHLNGTNWVKDGVIGFMGKDENGEKVFKPRTSWTAGQVIDYVRRASAAHFAELNKSEK